MHNPPPHQTVPPLELRRRPRPRYTAILPPIAFCLLGAAIVYADFIRRTVTPDASLAGSIVVHLIALFLLAQALTTIRAARRSRHARLLLDEDRITLTSHAASATIRLDEITRVAPVVVPLGGIRLSIATATHSLRVPFSLEGLGRLTSRLKAALDRRSLTHTYDPAALFRFYLLAERADRAALRRYEHFRRLAALTAAAALIGACLAFTTMPRDETGYLAIIWIAVWTLASSTGPAIGWTLAEGVFHAALLRSTDPDSLTSPPRDPDAERTVHLRCAIFVAALYAALSLTISFIRYL